FISHLPSVKLVLSGLTLFWTVRMYDALGLDPVVPAGGRVSSSRWYWIGGFPQIDLEDAGTSVSFSENCGLSPLLWSVRLFNGVTGTLAPFVTSTRIPLRIVGSPHRFAVGRLTGSLLAIVSVPVR